MRLRVRELGEAVPGRLVRFDLADGWPASEGDRNGPPGVAAWSLARLAWSADHPDSLGDGLFVIRYEMWVCARWRGEFDGPGPDLSLRCWWSNPQYLREWRVRARRIDYLRGDGG